MLSVNEIAELFKMQYIKKEVNDEVYFCHAHKIEVFFKSILIFWVCATRHVQSTQNKKFAYLCNISRKAWG